MSLLLRIAFRNLFRQKRRNLLLGLAYAISAAALIVASSFATGISSTLIDRVVTYAAGHANVLFAHEGRPESQVMRDGAAWKERIERIPHVVKVEPSMGVMARAIGNGRSDNVVLTAVNMHAAFSSEDSALARDNFPMAEGSWDALKDSSIENPLIISTAKAKYLKIGVGDQLRIRVQDFNGVFQAARLTLVGIFKPSNMFLDGSLFLELRDLGRIMGLRSEDSPSLYLTIQDPILNAAGVADSIWRLLLPAKALFEATLSSRTSPDSRQAAMVGGLKDDTAIWNGFAALLVGKTTLPGPGSGPKGAFVSSRLARTLGLRVGDTLSLDYQLLQPLHASAPVSRAGAMLAGIFDPPSGLPDSLVLLPAGAFLKHFDEAIPASPAAAFLDTSAFWGKALVSRWNLFPRASSAAVFQQQQRELSQGKHKGTMVSVNTMYEAASDVLQLESVLQLIIFCGVGVAFLIILIGVVNTLRMTIRERTREIGTLRAIGMQRRDIRAVFVLEAGLLALFASAAGTAVGLVLMAGLSAIPIDMSGNPLGVLLVRGRLVFEPTLGGVLALDAVIILLAVSTAWFPANRAAGISASAAMRHF